MTGLFGFAFILIISIKKVMERELSLFTDGGGGISDKVSNQLECYFYDIIVRFW